MSEEKISQAVSIVGGQSRLAESVGVKQPHIWNWLNRDKRVPAEYVIPVCEATQWVITPNDLRPDIYPNKNDGIPPEQSVA